MPETYAALLRGHAGSLRNMIDMHGGRLAGLAIPLERCADHCDQLASLLDRVTPEAINAVAADLDDLRYSLPGVAHRNRELIAAVRSLAAGPQPEEGRDA